MNPVRSEVAVKRQVEDPEGFLIGFETQVVFDRSLAGDRYDNVGLIIRCSEFRSCFRTSACCSSTPSVTFLGARSQHERPDEPSRKARLTRSWRFLSDTHHYSRSAPGRASDNAALAGHDQRQAVSDNTTDAILAGYTELLERSPLSANTRRAYRRQVAQYLAWLEERPGADRALEDVHARDFAVRDYRHDLRAKALGRLGERGAGGARPTVPALGSRATKGPA